MTQYRLLDNTVDVIEATDEFWDAASRMWKTVPYNFVGERFYAVIPYRRAIPDPEPVTRKIVLKEWLCWENADPQCVWLAWCTQSPAEPCETQESWDNAIPTGQEIEIEIPA